MTKVSIYVDDELHNAVKYLAEYDGVKLTALVNSVLKSYADSRANDVEFMRQRDQELIARRNSEYTEA